VTEISHVWVDGSEKPAHPERGVHVIDGDDIADTVARRVVSRALAAAETPDSRRLDELAHETVYAERTRLSTADVDPRTHSDRAFLQWLRRELAHSDDDRRRELVAIIVNRYVTEISGHFDRRVYGVATRIVPFALNTLLRGFDHGEGLPRPRLFDVDDRIVVDGAVATLRALSKIGTVVLAPTHVSNLDSVVLGSAIYRQGLPPFAYGAGLNLFSSGTMGFFMRHLGAYTVDRTKTDPLYRDTLKEYVTVLLEHGQHNLFFPGGTRSRSGALESHLKLGLLGTTATAFRNALLAGSTRPRIFVVPCTITYPLVLEAATLAEDYLRAEGGAHYIDARDESDHPRRWFDFLAGLKKLDHRVYVTIGRPLDTIGNEVDERGTSHDPHGRPIDPSRYFFVNGKVQADDARDQAYTRLLAASLVSAYKRDNLALPTSATAFVVLALLRKERREPDLFRFLRGVSPEASVSVDSVVRELGRLMREIRKLAADSSIRSSDTLGASSPEAVLAESLKTFATYHPTKVIERRADRLVVGDVNLLFYYGNRLSGYALLGEPSLVTEHQNGAG
jgi:glycerol-3-phosphate O-acyltransferase